ncbi:hypothetical protein EVAR_62917_1 [Eumeta japonica]|uniref:Uncharacterized protein n=1 Tax=Eumeta variegata TaxID=151549 RepID=A0A4C1ZSW4_EUMVA|nr:hypothetical protein EVAR_62917_1 [Eumeta japonica]
MENLMERVVGHRNYHSLDKTQQRKQPPHVCILRVRYFTRRAGLATPLPSLLSEYFATQTRQKYFSSSSDDIHLSWTTYPMVVVEFVPSYSLAIPRFRTYRNKDMRFTPYLSEATRKEKTATTIQMGRYLITLDHLHNKRGINAKRECRRATREEAQRARRAPAARPVTSRKLLTHLLTAPPFAGAAAHAGCARQVTLAADSFGLSNIMQF